MAGVLDAGARAGGLANGVSLSPPRALAALALEGMPIGVLIEDAAGSCWINAELARMWGRADADPVQPNEFEAALEPARPVSAYSSAWERLLGTTAHEPRWRRRRLRRLDGATTTVRISARAIQRWNGITGHATFVMEDGPQEADARMRQSFLAMVGHELRTPISSIVAGAELLRGGLDEETHSEVAALVVDEAHRVHVLVEQLTALALIQSSVVAEPVHVVHLVRKVAARESPRHPWMALRVPGLGASAPLALGDEALIAQALTILIDNAGKYGSRQIMEIEVESTGSEVGVHVLDRGPGLQGSDPGRLFELFERASPKSSTPGTGIGLYVVNQIVSAMGGRVWATDRDGGGADFGFALRVAT